MKEISIEENWSDPDDAPRLTQNWADGATAYRDGKPVKRGRPKLDNPKQQVSLRLDPEVINAYRGSGPGWQSRINDILREAAHL